MTEDTKQRINAMNRGGVPQGYKIVRPSNFAYNPMNIRFGSVARHKEKFPVYSVFIPVAPITNCNL